MNVFDSIKLSLNSIIHRKLRSWLTLLGIVIGVAAVVAIVSIGNNAQQSVNSRIANFGADILTISLGGQNAMGFGRGNNTVSSSSASVKQPILQNKDLIIIKANPNISDVSPIVSGRVDTYFSSETTKLNVRGIDPSKSENIFYLQLDSGRFLNNADSGSIVISYNVANEVFKLPITIGQQLSVGNRPFTVVGILQKDSSRSEIYMNYKNAWDVTDVNRDTFSSIQAKMYDVSQNDQTITDLTQSLSISRNVYGKPKDFSITSSKSIQQNLQDITNTLKLFLGSIAIISLIVGAIGVANSMFTSVLEKTKEIGILKSLGSTNFEIMRLFIIESGLFGFIGGLIGVIIGVIATKFVATFGIRFFGGSSISASISIELIIIVILLSTLIGIVSGLIPAISASKLRPVEALRYE